MKSMLPAILLFMVMNLFSGCATVPEPGELVLTHEDLMLKRRPYDPCGKLVDCAK